MLMVMLQILKSVDFAKTQKSRYLKKPFLPDNCRTYNMNDNPKNNILMSENIKQKRLTILEYMLLEYMIINICIEMFQNC